jgi:alpha-beta hydrolase superfamily lysophospholipase
VNESTFTLKTADGLDLYVRRWQSEGIVHRWTIVIVHGLGEHGGRYRHLAEWFTPKGATVYAMDLRGHGRSGGRRGDAPGLKALLDDIDAVVARARDESGGPIILLGHSFGGLLAIAYALDRPDEIDRAVFSAPLLMVKVLVPAWKRAAGKVLPKVAPRLSLSNEVDPELLSHDPAIAVAYRTDPLVHDRLSAGMYGDTIARGQEFIKHAPQLRVPFLLLQGSDDRIVDPAGSERFFARATAPGRAVHVYPAMFHEVLNEVDRERVFADIEAWLLS